jgi:putative membrane protein
MRSLTTYGMVTALLVTVCVTACQPSKKEEGSAGEAKQQNEANFDRDEEKDAEFIVNTVSGNLNIIALAQLALKKSTSQEVKSMAAILEKDRTKIQDELTTFAAKRGIAIPSIETSGAVIDGNELAESEGQAFDKKWRRSIADKYERRIAQFERRADKTDDMVLKAWIVSTLPTLRSHLGMLKAYKENSE